MALKNKNQSISLSAQSVIDLNGGEMSIAYFNATVDSVNSENINIGRTISNNAAYREHRTECLEDQTAFEDAVYAIVDSMTPKESTNETV